MSKVVRKRSADTESGPGEYYWHLQDNNGEIICQGESHPTPEAVQEAVNNVAEEFMKLAMNSQFPDNFPLRIPIVDE